MLFFFKKKFPDRDVSWAYTKAGDYLIMVDNYRVKITPELLNDMNIEQLHEFLVHEMNEQW